MRTPVLFGWCGSPKLAGVFYIVNPLYCLLCGRNIQFCESELRLLGSSEGGATQKSDFTSHNQRELAK